MFLVYLHLYLLHIHSVCISFLLVEFIDLVGIPLGNFLLSVFHHINPILHLLSCVAKNLVAVHILAHTLRMLDSLLAFELLPMISAHLRK